MTTRTGKTKKVKQPSAVQTVQQGEEELLAGISELLAQQGVMSPGDIEALLRFLDALEEGDLDEGSDERDRAQDLAFDAMEARTKKRALALYEQALVLDPDCVDAIAGMVNLQSRGVEEKIAGLELAVAAGARVLGAAFFKRQRGSFWGLIQTRPYMRARAQLGMLLLGAGRAAEAATHFAEMLELNPNDNQGVRDSLMVAYLAIGDLDRAGRLRRRYEHDAGALWSWSAVLEDFLSGELARAKNALGEARGNNRFVAYGDEEASCRDARFIRTGRQGRGVPLRGEPGRGGREASGVPDVAAGTGDDCGGQGRAGRLRRSSSGEALSSMLKCYRRSMAEALLTTSLGALPLLARGKVRDIYAVSEAPDADLLLVATDRISAFDLVLGSGIPDKGRILTQISLFWFEFLRELVPNHLVTAEVDEFPAALQPFREQLEGRTMLVRLAQMFPVECVARGYLSGSGWKDYQATGSVCGISLPTGLRESDRLPEPIFTPAAKINTGGHDENISFATVIETAGEEHAQALRGLTMAIYTKAADYALSKGVILADTKFEFGLIEGVITLADEVLTPDSSRYWPADQYRPGGPTPSFDKQYVRDYLESIGWNKQAPAPSLPEEVVARTRAKYLQAFQLLTGRDSL